MGIYLGCVETKQGLNGEFYNFSPIYVFGDDEFKFLDKEERKTLLPESEKLNINFTYDFYNNEHVTIMHDNFEDQQIIAIEFSQSDLTDNYNNFHERNLTGYKIDIIEAVKAGKIHKLEEYGMYRLIGENELVSDFYESNPVLINGEGLCKGMKVFVDIDVEIYAGPYEIKYRGADSQFYIKPEISENKYIIEGYAKKECERRDIVYACTYADEYCNVIKVYSNMSRIGIDRITDLELIDSFKEHIISHTDELSKDFLYIDSYIDEAMQHYQNSILMGENITKEIRDRRMQRLNEILSSEQELDQNLSIVTDNISSLLIKYLDRPNVQALLESLFNSNPDTINKLQSVRIVQQKIEDLEQKRNKLQDDCNLLEKEIEEKREEEISVKNTQVLDELNEEIIEKKKQLEEMVEKYELISDIQKLREEQAALKNDVYFHTEHQKRLEDSTNKLEKAFIDVLSNNQEKIFDVAFDGFMANKVLSAAAQWELQEDDKNLLDAVKAVNSISVNEKDSEQLIEYLYTTIAKERPGYDKNSIINMIICISQGFLTVFAGEPGCGKTSICNIIAKTLGLNKVNQEINSNAITKINVNRYVSVSVERGWTSKRDLVGYYNPLTKTFDINNKEMYMAMKILNTESSECIDKFPFIVLLDEANLSPMEYYWAEFMQISDNLESKCCINLGQDNNYNIPETLHFVATINNDHTTEILSPRLIDRAWVISLPYQKDIKLGKKIELDDVELVSWKSIKNVFIPSDDEVEEYSVEVKSIFDSINTLLEKQGIIISPRSKIAMKKYWYVASKYFENDQYNNDASIVAFDYAILQKVLPRISGSGVEYKEWLEEFKKICESKNLLNSSQKIKDIIDRGNEQMNYYQFWG